MFCIFWSFCSGPRAAISLCCLQRKISEKWLTQPEHLAVKKADMFLRRQTSFKFIRWLKRNSNRMIMLLCKKNDFWCLVQNVIFRSDDDSTAVEWGGKHTESDIDENVRWCSSKRMQSFPSFDWSEVEAAVTLQSLFIFSLRSISEVFHLCFISAGSADSLKVSFQSSHYRKIHWSQNSLEMHVCESSFSLDRNLIWWQREIFWQKMDNFFGFLK